MHSCCSHAYHSDGRTYQSPLGLSSRNCPGSIQKTTAQLAWLFIISNLLKIYETLRLIDTRARTITFIPAEQAGFRPDFSPHTILTRLDILIGHARARHSRSPVFFVLLDYQEAFERAWRDGILFRLWEAGIRGKLWRTCQNLLQDTFYYVRTNFGDTTPFRTTMGVVQGSVLAALFFTLLITPLVEALRAYSPVINGMRIAPRFFAE